MQKQVKVVVIGGGFAGCAAAAAASRAGADVTLVERSDALTGLGQLGGSFRLNAFFIAHEEIIAMGGGDMPKAQDSETMYTNIELKHQHHVSLYNCRKISKTVDKVLRELGVKIMYRSRATDVELSGKRIKKIKLEDGRVLEADSFVEATGTCGPMALCKRYGHGCVSCGVGCPTFGGRVSIAARAGIEDMVGVRADGTPGGFSGAITFSKGSLAPEIERTLEERGELKMPLPKELVPIARERVKELAPSLTPESADTVQLTYVGHVNMVGNSHFTLEELHKIPGFENAVFVSPSKGWIGNSIRYLAVTPRDHTMKVEGIENLFVAGEKAGGQHMSTTAAIVTGVPAGHNAVRRALGMELLELPTTSVIGYYLAYTADHQGDLKVRHSLGRTPTIDHIYEQGPLTYDAQLVHRKIEELGLTGIFSKKLV